MIRKTLYTLLVISFGCLCSCHKKDLLNQKSDSLLFVPSTLDDFQTLLDNDVVMSETPVLGEVSADNYYVGYNFWQPLNLKERNAYIWAPDIYGGVGSVGDWNFPYQQVFYANVVLDGINKVALTNSNAERWKAIKGAALFIRAYAFYNLAQVFAPLYDNEIVDVADLGIPLRLTPNVDVPSTRSTIKQTYNQILTDLKEASSLLPTPIQAPPTRPCKLAALTMIARTYLSMRLYDQAGLYADSCLKLNNTLIDYNTINVNASRPFDKNNIETLYHSRLLSTTSVIKNGQFVKDCIVDSTLFQSFAIDDLRRSAFFYTSTPPNIKGGYTGQTLIFSGVATDETYLIRAECNARQGSRTAAMNDLNKLLQNRWKTGTFVPYTASTDAEALSQILIERRKELCFRGLRWTDLKRLNKEGANITLTRVLNGETTTLAPNSPLYVLPIPPDVIQLSGIKQNDR